MRLAETDDLGGEILQGYINDKKDFLKQTFQEVVDRISEMFDYLNGLPRNELKRRPALVEAGRIMIEAFKNIKPYEDENGRFAVPLSDMDSWQKHLMTSLQQVELVRLYWIADVLNLQV